jgi:hypothetical protein
MSAVFWNLWEHEYGSANICFAHRNLQILYFLLITKCNTSGKLIFLEFSLSSRRKEKGATSGQDTT